MVNRLNVCLFPMNVQWGDKEANLNTLKNAVEAVPAGTDILILPEMFSTGFITGATNSLQESAVGVSNKEYVRSLAEWNSGSTLELLEKIAANKGFAIAGSFIADTGGSLFNRAFFVEPMGDTIVADKRHLFSMAGENKIFSAGDSRLKVRYRGWNIAMVVCYDIRFPIWCRNVGCEYDLLIAVANWPKVRIDAWNQLLKARAIENLAYVCGVNCTGCDSSGFEYDGLSLAYDFKGKDITRISPDSPFRFATFDYESLERFRTKFPAWQDADQFTLEI